MPVKPDSTLEMLKGGYPDAVLPENPANLVVAPARNLVFSIIYCARTTREMGPGLWIFME